MAKFLLILPLLIVSSLASPLEDTQTKAKDIGIIGGFVFYRVVDDKIEYLLMKKAKEDDWSPPKGNLEGKESTIETAIRETREETGWLVSEDYSAYTQYQVYFEYETKESVLKQVHLWTAQLTNFDKPIQLSPEHSEYVWQEYEEAIQTIKKQYRAGLTQGDTVVRAHKQCVSENL